MSKRMALAIWAALAVVALGPIEPTKAAENVQPILLTPRMMHSIAKIDERFLSYNVEMAEVIGGDFWKPYTPASIAALKAQVRPASQSHEGPPTVAGRDPTMFQARPPIDFSNARLRKLASALAPAYIRTSGTWANSIYFYDTDDPPPASPPDGFQGVLTRSAWKDVIAFSRSVGAKLVTSFAISAGVRDASGAWTPDQARKFMTYTKQEGGEIAGAEFFNEPDMPVFGGAPTGYNAADYARDFAIFRNFAIENAPNMEIVGPGSVGEGVLQPLMSGVETAGFVSTNNMLSAKPPPKYDVFSYHFYGAASIRCVSMGAGAQTTPEAALSEAWLARADTSYDFYVRGLRDRFEQGEAVWITETADSACGGNPWASTFLDSFRFLDQLARMARQGVSAVFHNTLASSEYGLLDQKTFAPRPNYWAALLWRKLMGPIVLDAGPLQPGLHLYGHCLRNHAGGIALLAINLSRSQTKAIDLPTAADIYVLTAPELEQGEVELNGRELQLRSDDELPDLLGKRVSAGRIDLKPASINFLAVSDAENKDCE